MKSGDEGDMADISGVMGRCVWGGAYTMIVVSSDVDQLIFSVA